MKKIYVISVVFLSVIMLLYSSCSTTVTPESSYIQKEKVNMLKVADSPNTHPFNGFSVEWDPHLFRNWNMDITSMNEMFDPEQDWPLFVKRIQEMKLQRARMMMQPEWFSNADGSYDFSESNEAVLAVIKQLDLAQAFDIRINLTIWCADRNSFLGFSNSPEWCSAPNDIEAYADVVVHILREFRVNLGYSCIRELTLFNEPSWAYYGADGKVSFADYSAMVRKVDERLREENLRDLVKLVVSDDAEHTAWYKQSVDTLTDIADIYASHTYAYGMETTNRTISDWAKEHTSYSATNGGNKPFLVDEFGTNNVIPPMKATDVYTYERGLFLAKFSVDVLNSGVSGVSYWCMYDENYGYGNRMEVGLWGFADEHYAVRPTYHAWSALNHYTSVDSLIYEIASDAEEELTATAFRAQDGRWTYVVVNLSEVSHEFSLFSGQKQQERYQRILYAEDTLSEPDTLLSPDKNCIVSEGKFTDILPAQSFAIYYGQI